MRASSPRTRSSAGQAHLSHLEQQCEVERAAGHAVLAHTPVGGQPVGDSQRLLEARAAGPQLDVGDAALGARIAPGVEAVWVRDDLVARFELVAYAVDLDRELPFEQLEAFAVSEVVVRGDLPAGRHLELGERPRAARLLARLEEGGCVALDGVVDPPRKGVDGGRFHSSALAASGEPLMLGSVESQGARHCAMPHTVRPSPRRALKLS
jgi:hypothetical protein